MRVWLQKQKKKEEAKLAAQTETLPVEATPAAPEVPPASDTAEEFVASVEETPNAGSAGIEQTAAENAAVAGQRAVSAAQQPNEVGLSLFISVLSLCICDVCKKGGLLRLTSGSLGKNEHHSCRLCQ
jgi:hypothetical protein